MRRASGKIAVVTGAAQGMGAAFARLLTMEGARVMLTDVLSESGEATAAALGPNAHFAPHDVTSEADWHAVIAATESRWGPVSVLINNAAIVHHAPLESMSEVDYRRVIDVNQVGVFLGMKTVFPSMKRAGGGSIINISSVAGIVGAALEIGYVASKFAVRGMTKAAAIEYAPHQIRVNSVHPGVIRTRLTQTTPTTEPLLKAILRESPAGRLGEPDEVGHIVLMLATDESRFMTGAELVIDGGLSCR
ncbi:MAG TPA: glucose 1-dehydrogenase [Steroidobacteraceae bacterium]|nr:glucose 1-dehydrogenase [Steroidobacteraceae bacterium]